MMTSLMMCRVHSGYSAWVFLNSVTLRESSQFKTRAQFTVVMKLLARTPPVSIFGFEMSFGIQ